MLKPEAEMTGARAGRHGFENPLRRLGGRAEIAPPLAQRPPVWAAQAANAPGQLQRQYTHMTKA